MVTELKERHLIEAAKKHQSLALSLVRQSDCLEANYGVVIFGGDKAIGQGYNHIPTDLIGVYSCEKFPRYDITGLTGGVSSELCISIRGEQAAIANMLKTAPGEEAVAP